MVPLWGKLYGTLEGGLYVVSMGKLYGTSEGGILWYLGGGTL